MPKPPDMNYRDRDADAVNWGNHRWDDVLPPEDDPQVRRLRESHIHADNDSG